MTLVLVASLYQVDRFEYNRYTEEATYRLNATLLMIRATETLDKVNHELKRIRCKIEPIDDDCIAEDQE